MTLPTTTAAWTIPADASSIHNLTKQTLPLPALGPHQVLIRLRAACLNYRDILVATRSPNYPGNHKPNLTLGSDGSGIIHATGPSSKWAGREGVKVVLHPNSWLTGDVRNMRLDRVYGAFDQDGTLAEWKVADDERVVEFGGHLSAGESSALLTAGVTAWSAIREGMDGRLDGNLGQYEGSFSEKRLEGKTVLTMGTGGVSCFGIQIASALGAIVIATSSSDSKLEIAKSLGATHTINYANTPDWDEEVIRLTKGKGVDQVLEVGGAQTLIKSINSTRAGGLVSLIGILSESGTLPKEVIPAVLFGGKIVKGCVAFSRDITAEFVQFTGEHGIKPVIAKEYGFDEVVQAMETLQKGEAVGKVVVNIGEE
ncbi:putative alcohol dehydrogenase [Lentithecium fluviatile CBS 122367]|uniref:Putative alcohol dehydrogenase n=1 Tax=Lentithecium fluviatile CBS 122367 TaxID=1168545 RepID=A0A6G1JGF6_9PLEO|nr:putative alcohol dehydrogenase [Lentithecium fluviatile CBS 122367]